MSSPGKVGVLPHLALASCFVATAASVLFFFPLPRTSFILQVIELPNHLPGDLIIGVRSAAGVRVRPEGVRGTLVITRFAHLADERVLLAQQSGDVRPILLGPEEAQSYSIPISSLAGAESLTVTALLFDDSEDYLLEIAARRTVSPQGIAPYARADVRVSRSAGGVSAVVE